MVVDYLSMSSVNCGGWLTFGFNAGTTPIEAATPFAVFERCAFRLPRVIGNSSRTYVAVCRSAGESLISARSYPLRGLNSGKWICDSAMGRAQHRFPRCLPLGCAPFENREGCGSLSCGGAGNQKSQMASPPQPFFRRSEGSPARHCVPREIPRPAGKNAGSSG